MIRDWLTLDKINVINSIDNWKNAVRLSAEPLLAQGIWQSTILRRF